MPGMNRVLCRTIAVLALAVAPFAAIAQTFPTKPIRIIVGNPPGGVNDILGRVLSAGMGKALGQSIVVENKPGAGGMIAAEFVAKQAPADGYVLLITSPGIALFPIFEKELRFDPIKDFNHISTLVEGQLVMWTNMLTPFKTFAELVDYAKANPNKLNFTAPGLQSHPAIIFEGMRQKIGIAFVTIPTKGTSESRVLVATNEAQVGFNDIGTAVQESQAGRGRPLAVTGPHRLAAFPNVPTFTEMGHAELFIPFSLGIAAPAATPAPVIARISSAVSSAMTTPEARDTFAKAGLDVLALNPQDSARRIAVESAFFMSVARKAGIVK